jgi:hypothetical protein
METWKADGKQEKQKGGKDRKHMESNRRRGKNASGRKNGMDKNKMIKPVPEPEFGIRIRKSKARIRIRILPFSHKNVEWTEIVVAK